MHSWKQGDMFLAEQKSRDCFDFISDVGICGVHVSLALGTAKFKQQDKSCPFRKCQDKFSFDCHNDNSVRLSLCPDCHLSVYNGLVLLFTIRNWYNL